MEHREQLEKIENKVDAMHDKMDDMAVILTRQEINISHHIARTDKLEEIVIPLRDQYQQLIGIGKFVGAISIISGILYSIISIIKS